MSQGWSVDNVAHTITFLEAPANGAAIAVNEFSTPSSNATSLWAFGAFGAYSGYPVDVELYSNRLWFAGTTNNPTTVWASKISQWDDFGTSVPIEDDDAITATMVAKQVNAIQDMVPLSDLVELTTGNVWRTMGGTNNVITPSTISFKPQSNFGCSALGSLVVGDSAIFVQATGAHVRDLEYDFATDKYTGNDLTVFASHLVEGHTIVDWAYQAAPFSTVWIVRDDGVLLCMAYFKEQQVLGWSHCDTTNGFYESVCSVTEGNEDAVYVVVRRVINGEIVRYVERLDTRFQTDQRDYFFVDAGLSYDGRNTTIAPTASMSLSGGVNWDETEALTLTCAGYAPFAASNIGDWVKLYQYTPQLDANGNAVTNEFGVIQQTQSLQVAQITAYIDPNNVTVQAIGTVPVSFRGVGITSWDFCPATFSGLSHLIGQTVAILADGNVKPQQTVSSAGSVTLDYPAAVVHVGLPIQSDFETLEVNAIGQEGVRDKRKIISKVSLIVTNSRGGKIGPDPDHLYELPSRMVSDNYYPPNSLQNDLLEGYPSGTWSTSGRVFVRQDDPLPLTILSVIADVSVAGG